MSEGVGAMTLDAMRVATLQLMPPGGARMLAHEAALRRKTTQTLGWRSACGGGYKKFRVAR
jgi:hypothetical protein